MPVSVIVPAYNEENTIGRIISVVNTVQDVLEMIVVSDGSADATAEVARSFGAKVIELEYNMGKGGAMMVGAKAAQSENLLFLDADLIGLTPCLVQQMIDPLLCGAADMTRGVFGKGRFATDLAQIVAPSLTGQRAIKKELMEKISDLEVSGFGVEVALNRYAEKHGLKVKEVLLPGMSHVTKEEKLGLAKGLAARMKMYWEIAKVAGKR